MGRRLLLGRSDIVEVTGGISQNAGLQRQGCASLARPLAIDRPLSKAAASLQSFTIKSIHSSIVLRGRYNRLHQVHRPYPRGVLHHSSEPTDDNSKPEKLNFARKPLHNLICIGEAGFVQVLQGQVSRPNAEVHMVPVDRFVDPAGISGVRTRSVMVVIPRPGWVKMVSSVSEASCSLKPPAKTG